jgi:RNA-directed DNA polymerase
LTNFFGSIDDSRVKTVLQERFNCNSEASQILTKLLTYKGSLPQGAPTSPVIANFAALALDAALMQVCRDVVGADNFAYSRYVDDITISGTSALIELLPQLSSKIAECGFSDNVQKTKILRQSTRQWVTGLVVNKSLNAPKKLIRRIRQELYYCHKFGLTPHCEWRGVPVDQFVRQITGSIGYVGIAQPELANAFRYELDTLTRSFGLTPAEIFLHQLKSIISRQRFATFVYHDMFYKVAPSQIELSEDGIVELHAFQLTPEQGWTQFALSDITDLLEIDAQV